MLLAIGYIYTNKDYVINKLIIDVEESTNTDITFTSTNISVIDKFPNLLLSTKELEIKVANDSSKFII